ncbi:conjugal transfer protein TraD [Legionella lytica]|uniref:Conjugal transfer protein TraD n=1 Tax=Legionella lytica TaxID=96232 RepID=A0ABW8D5B6_9GAMM
MALLEEIEKEKQMLARCKKSLAIEKLKKRRLDTRHKIELGGLVIKSEMDLYDKSIILGSLVHSQQLILKQHNCLNIFKLIGDKLFKKND